MPPIAVIEIKNFGASDIHKDANKGQTLLHSCKRIQFRWGSGKHSRDFSGS